MNSSQTLGQAVMALGENWMHLKQSWHNSSNGYNACNNCQIDVVLDAANSSKHGKKRPTEMEQLVLIATTQHADKQNKK